MYQNEEGRQGKDLSWEKMQYNKTEKMRKKNCTNTFGLSVQETIEICLKALWDGHMNVCTVCQQTNFGDHVMSIKVKPYSLQWSPVTVWNVIHSFLKTM